MKVRRFSISAMLLVIIIVVLVVSTVTLSLFSISHSNRSITEAVQQRMLDVANCAAASVDGDALEKLTADDMDSPEYWKAYNALAVFRDNVSLEYVYGIKDEGNNKFTFTVDPALEDAADFGDEVATTDALIGASKGTPGVDDEPYADEWGLHYSAYSPVHNSAGKVAGIIGVDFDATWYDEQITSHTRTVILVSLCMLVLGVVIVLFVSINIKKRFKILNKMLVSLADGSGDLTRKLEIRSGDEFEVLANSMNEFIVQMRAIVGGVKDNVAEFTSASDNLTIVAEKASGTMDNLSIAIAEVAKGASVQAEDVATSSEDVKDIVSKLSEMTQSAQRAEKYADDMSKS